MTGSGTQFNMNINEVIANRCSQLAREPLGSHEPVHPNDHVNCSQSTNDAYPTAIKLAVIFSLKDTLAAMGELRSALHGKEIEFAQVIKMGRTENQDAVPMTLGQEFGAYAVMIDTAMAALKRSVEELHEINMGATAIGTGINSPPGYADLVAKAVERETGIRPELSTTGGTSDARFIKDFCPVAEFGMAGSTMHKVDERVPGELVEHVVVEGDAGRHVRRASAVELDRHRDRRLLRRPRPDR